ncbi:MAG: hypothetical protein SPE01_13730 [Candidatus Spyradocola sp.]|nr:hypothetical protein [Candidatus Spyradocola sp.]
MKQLASFHFSLSTKSTGSKKMKPHLFRIAEKFAHGLAAHDFSVSEAIFHLPMGKERWKQRLRPAYSFLTYRKSLLGGVHAPACGLKMKGLRPLHASSGSTCLFFDRLKWSEAISFIPLFYIDIQGKQDPIVMEHNVEVCLFAFGMAVVVA